MSDDAEPDLGPLLTALLLGLLAWAIVILVFAL